MLAAVSLAGRFTTRHSITGGTNDGGSSFAALVQGGDGIFYGTTQFGGMYGKGTVFELSTNGG